MQVPAGSFGMVEPAGHFGAHASRQVVQHDVHLEIPRDVQVDEFEEGQHIRAGVAFAGVVEHLGGGHVQRREQLHGAVPLVAMGHGPGPARLHRQRRLGLIQRLTLRFLVEGEHHRLLRRVHVQPHHIDDLVLEAGIVRHLERRCLPRASSSTVATSTDRALKGRCEPPLRSGSHSASGRPLTALPHFDAPQKPSAERLAVHLTSRSTSVLLGCQPRRRLHPAAGLRRAGGDPPRRVWGTGMAAWGPLPSERPSPTPRRGGAPGPAGPDGGRAGHRS